VIGRVLVMAALLGAAGRSALAGTEPLNGSYLATAYTQKGITASGQYVHRHVVAADPDVLPIGTRIKIRLAGRYSGEYVVADTGDKIQGRRLDIYLPTARACKKFGSKPVKVRVVQLGDGTHAAAKQADQAVKEDVKKDVDNKVVGNAATEADWAATHPRTTTSPAGTAVKSNSNATSTAPAKSNPPNPLE